MKRKQIYKEQICKYCKAKCNKKIEIIKDNSTICTKCVDYKSKEIKERIRS